MNTRFSRKEQNMNRYATGVFCRVLAAISQQGIISSEKRRNLIECWQKSTAENDAEMLRKLIGELSAQTTNGAWLKELNAALETI
jgi:hypothetical protein